MSCTTEQLEGYLVTGAEISKALGSQYISSFPEAWELYNLFGSEDFVTNIVAINGLTGYNYYKAFANDAAADAGGTDDDKKAFLILAEKTYKLANNVESGFDAVWPYVLYLGETETAEIAENILPGCLLNQASIFRGRLAMDNALAPASRKFDLLSKVRLLKDAAVDENGDIGDLDTDAADYSFSFLNDYAEVFSVYNAYVTKIAGSDTPVLLTTDHSGVANTAEAASAESLVLRTDLNTYISFIKINQNLYTANDLYFEKGVGEDILIQLVEIDGISGITTYSAYAETVCSA